MKQKQIPPASPEKECSVDPTKDPCPGPSLVLEGTGLAGATVGALTDT
jgi:hypothetical protein